MADTTDRIPLLDDVLELARIDLARWPEIDERIRLSGHPTNEDPPAGDPPAGDPPAADPPAGDPPAGDPPGDLGEKGKAALDAERKARSDAEKRAKAAEKRAGELEKAQLSETDRLKKEAEEAKGLVSSATDKLRRANLLTALADKGLEGAKAKAAARLLDGVEFNDDDEPTNLDAALTAAKAEFGDQLFEAGGSGGAGGRGKPKGKGQDGGATPPAPGATGDEHPAGMARIRAGYAAASREQ
jgi:hypothetical protein